MSLVTIIIFYGVASEFIEKRPKKNLSINTLKEECCEQFGEILKLVPPLLQSVACIQKEALTAIQGYWQGEKQSWCERASRQKLTTCQERLHLLQARINAVLDECKETMKELQL
jgi:hypothetical protein